MFEDTLEITMTVTISDTDYSIPGSNVKELDLDLHSYGFNGRAVFMVSSEDETDDLFDSFTTQDLAEVSLEVSRYYVDDDDEAETLSVSGIVTRKSILTEMISRDMDISDAPILYRSYSVEFADAASVLWGQHYPYDLLVDGTMEDLLESHKGSKITLTYDWDTLSTEQSIIAVPCGFDQGGGSFYDFVMWYVDTQNGVWTYDYDSAGYKLASSKSTDGDATSLDRRDVTDVRVEFPETGRHNVYVLNSYSEDAQSTEVTNSYAVDGVQRSFLARYAVSSDYTTRQTLETNRLIVRQHEVRLTFGNTPLTAAVPGTLIQLQDNYWSDKIFSYGNVYRVRDLTLKAKAANAEASADHNLSFNIYDIELELQAEVQDETWVSLPPYTPPKYPFDVEGKILSEEGDDTDDTFESYEDEDTSLYYYKVKIPLWSDAQVVVPFDPGFFPGHFYFPAYRDARVLVALGLNSASIARFLDWRDDAQLTVDSQGNKLLMGKSASSQTYMSHYYDDDNPVFGVQRTNSSDVQTITLEEGSLILEVKESDDESS